MPSDVRLYFVWVSVNVVLFIPSPWRGLWAAAVVNLVRDLRSAVNDDAAAKL